MKQLILAEKPSAAKDLNKMLGANQKHKNYYEEPRVIVTWVPGHLLRLKMPGDLNKEWQSRRMDTLPTIPRRLGIKPFPRTGHQLKAIKQLVQRKDVSKTVIAIDAGGGRGPVTCQILEYMHFNKPVKWLWIPSRIDRAIKTGSKQLRPAEEYDVLHKSAFTRAKVDWLVGLNVTRALIMKYADNSSAGHAQTPILVLVRDQEKKIEQFRPQTYFTITLQTGKEQARILRKNQFALKTQGKA